MQLTVVVSSFFLNSFSADYSEAYVHQDSSSGSCHSVKEVWLRLGGWQGTQV